LNVPISDIVQVTISVSAVGPTRAGFGEPLIAAYHTHYTDRVREYSSLAAMVSDGFAATDPAYLAAAEVFSQSPSPPLLKVGRRALPMTQTLHLTLLSTATTDTYVVQVRTAGGSWHVVTTPSTGVPTTDAASMATTITGLSLTGLTATSSGAVLTLAMTAGKLLDVQPGTAALITFADVTADPGISTDLDAILAADANWYGLVLDSQGKAEIAAAAVWVEANKKFFAWNNSDSADADSSSTTDIFYTEKALGHQRSFGLFAQTQLLCYSGAAWEGRLFPTDPGSENWAFKTLSGVPADALTDSQVHAVENKNGSVYTTIFGLNLTQFGKTPGGEYADIVRGTDALTNAIQVGILALQANSLKIPFTEAGIDMYRSVIIGALNTFVAEGFLAAVPAPFVSVPKVSQVSATDKANRNLPLVSFSATLAGAINSTQIQGVLTS
jgi:hypothetical protein